MLSAGTISVAPCKLGSSWLLTQAVWMLAQTVARLAKATATPSLRCLVQTQAPSFRSRASVSFQRVQAATLQPERLRR